MLRSSARLLQKVGQASRSSCRQTQSLSPICVQPGSLSDAVAAILRTFRTAAEAAAVGRGARMAVAQLSPAAASASRSGAQQAAGCRVPAGSRLVTSGSSSSGGGGGSGLRHMLWQACGSTASAAGRAAVCQKPGMAAAQAATRQTLGTTAGAAHVSSRMWPAAAAAAARRLSHSTAVGQVAGAARQAARGLRADLRDVFRPASAKAAHTGGRLARQLPGGAARRPALVIDGSGSGSAIPSSSGAAQQARRFSGYAYQNVTLRPTIDPMRVLYGLIGANVAVFILWRVNPQLCYKDFVTSPQHLVSGRIWTLLTAAFSHRDFSHLAVNMITFYFFGQELALMFGPRVLVGLYVVGGVVASIAHNGWYYSRAVSEGGPPQAKEARLQATPPALGASGAVSAIVLADILLAPMRLVIVFPIPIPMPAFILGILWVANDLSGSVRGTDNVGHVAHLGGAATGAAFYWAWRRGLLRRWR